MGFKDDGVPSLVQAVREHRKFKQLACYSIECVAKVNNRFPKTHKGRWAITRIFWEHL